jgi:hypothetical protein
MHTGHGNNDNLFSGRAVFTRKECTRPRLIAPHKTAVPVTDNARYQPREIGLTLGADHITALDWTWQSHANTQSGEVWLICITIRSTSPGMHSMPAAAPARLCGWLPEHRDGDGQGNTRKADIITCSPISGLMYAKSPSRLMPIPGCFIVPHAPVRGSRVASFHRLRGLEVPDRAHWKTSND